MSFKTYAFKYNDDDVLINSSSGGAFSAFSEYVLNTGGMVFGAVYDYRADEVKHTHAETIKERNEMRGSKYIQSKLGNTYEEVAKALVSDRQVLFTGTICQVAGLKNYLTAEGVNCERLLCCDIICHGVASPLIWKEYIHYKSDGEVKYLNFRDKMNGWIKSGAVAEDKKGRIDLNDYMRLFYSHSIMRPSCYSCLFTSINRCSDITIGDFWGIENLENTFDYSNGASFVMTNNLKGETLFRSVLSDNPQVVGRECAITDVRQPNLYAPTKMSIIRTRFWRDFKRNGIAYVVKKYASDSVLYNKIVLIQKVVDLLSNKIRR